MCSGEKKMKVSNSESVGLLLLTVRLAVMYGLEAVALTKGLVQAGGEDAEILMDKLRNERIRGTAQVDL